MSAKGNNLARGYLWMAANSAAIHNPAVRLLYQRLRGNAREDSVRSQSSCASSIRFHHTVHFFTISSRAEVAPTACRNGDCAKRTGFIDLCSFEISLRGIGLFHLWQNGKSLNCPRRPSPMNFWQTQNLHPKPEKHATAGGGRVAFGDGDRLNQIS